ncbi:trimeric LpxA-like protein [Aspergillus carlsbadensis]|nr:trimeric LpxA-like protein [Aspergillus carlsbadensis]
MSQQNLLRPPPHHRPSTQSQSQPPSGSSTPKPAAPPITASSSATIAESALFQGTFPVTIGRGTIIHPRARIYSFAGPVVIGNECIISEKCVIGTVPGMVVSTAGNINKEERRGGEDGAIQISSSVTIGPVASVAAGVTIHSGVVIETAAVLNAGVDIGAHSKICARAEISAGARIREWTVVWGAGKGVNLRRRVRVQGAKVNPIVQSLNGGNPATAGDKAEDGGMLEGSIIEDARLLGMRREREALARFLAGSKGRR